MNKEGNKKIFVRIYNFLKKIFFTKKVFNSAIILNFAIFGLIFFLRVLMAYYTDEDPALIQAVLLMAIAFFGTYGYLLNMLFEKDERKSVMESHLYTVLVMAIFTTILSLMDPTISITEDSMYYWLIRITQMFFIVLFLSMTTGSIIFILQQKPAETSTDNSTKASETKE